MKRAYLHVTLGLYPTNEPRHKRKQHHVKLPILEGEQRPGLTCCVRGSYNKIRRAVRFMHQHGLLLMEEMIIYRNEGNDYSLYVKDYHQPDMAGARQAYFNGLWRGACKFKRSFRNQPTT